MAIIFPHIQWTITTDFIQDLYMPWIINKPKGWYVSIVSNFLNFKVKKEVLAFESIWIVKSCFAYEVYFYTFKLISSEPLLPFYLIGSTMPMFVSLCYFKYLWKSIKKYANKPPIFYLQLDNCVKDNKNQFVIYFVFNHLF
jgi:hypothetical protein